MLGTQNEYAARLEKELCFRLAPKKVYAALAFSLAMRLCDDDEAAAVAFLRTEWGVLNQNGIVRQKPHGARASVATKQSGAATHIPGGN